MRKERGGDTGHLLNTTTPTKSVMLCYHVTFRYLIERIERPLTIGIQVRRALSGLENNVTWRVNDTNYMPIEGSHLLGFMTPLVPFAIAQ